MSKSTSPEKRSHSHSRYGAEFKREALALAERLGVATAAKQLTLHESQLYNGRSRARLEQHRGAAAQDLAADKRAPQA